ncbi:MAG: hypothetical protein AAGF31_10685 [Planctomycetota bacterium]
MTTEHNPFAAPLTSEEAPTPNTFQAEHPESLEKVRKGLLMVYISICGILLLMIGAAVLGGVAAAAGPQGGAAIGILALVGFGILGLAILNLVGVCFCLAAPDSSNGRPLVVASLVLQISSFVLAFAGQFVIAAAGGGLIAMQIVQAITNLMSFAAIICFLLFLWRMADYIERPDVAGRAKRTMIIGAVSLGAIIVTGITFGTMAAGGGPPGDAVMAPVGIVMAVSGLGVLIATIMYANTITYLRKAIGEVLQGTPATNLPPIA